MPKQSESHRQTLMRRAARQIADLKAKPPAKNKAGASRRQGAINRAMCLIECLKAGDHSANWHNYNPDGTKKPPVTPRRKKCKRHQYSMLYNDGGSCINCGATA